ncbi:hypothetical protein MKK54_15045 [Methylobacterium sp. J-068]|nr:hypothetical protein [Methylobacterium sp. J-068]
MNVVKVRAQPALWIFTPTRIMKWQGAFLAAGFALALLLGPVFDTGGQWARFSEWATKREWGVVIGVVALIRIAALLINGHWRRTPALRAGTALLGAGLWAFVSVMFIVPDEPVTTGVFVYGVLAWGDLVSAWFAARDAATADWLWKKAMRENPPARTYWEPSA